VDKVIGEAARFGRLPLSDALLMVSGRTGFEIVHKARRAGIPILCSVSAPSSLAVRLAREGGQTLVGFLRDGRCNVYCGAERVEGGGGTATRATRRG
jgi:FdhD protein